MGMLRVIAAPSAPSAMIHLACGLSPVSSSSVFKVTPVHSAQLTRPLTSAAVLPHGGRNDGLPEHSMKCTRDTAGNWRISSTVKIKAFSVRP
ncbi:hypothetical protein D3C80_1588720 [compost metagenome]